MKAALPALLLLLATPALAQTETILVSADLVHLLDDTAGEAATGLMLPLALTPRAATQVSETTLSRYGVEGLDDLTAITPSSYTGSFYGVEGSVNLRGTLAENYFRGFKRAENRGTYDTPLEGDVTILRGPAIAGLWRGQGRRAGGFRARCGHAERQRHPHLWRL